MGVTSAHDELGIYVHIPFCSVRCDYCDFATWTDRAHLVGEYVNALLTQLRDLAPSPASTVFFGGGTPSLLDPALLGQVLDSIPRLDDAEVTVECNPDNVTAELMATYASHGVNRVSLGVQSTSPKVLQALGRQHTPANVVSAARHIADAGIDRYNVDLIFGTLGETDDDFEQSIHEVMALSPRPTHVSAYALIAEPGTPLGQDLSRHPDDDVQAARYAIADGVLSTYGLHWYEISNWSIPGHECRHNQLYWNGSPYEAIGCAAHGHRDGHRWWNYRTPDRYIAAVQAHQSPVAGQETLDPAAHQVELLQLGVRTSHGVPTDALDVHGVEHLVTNDGDRWVLTLEGRLLANEVSIRLRSPSATAR